MYQRFALKSFSGCVSTGREWSSRIRAGSRSPFCAMVRQNSDEENTTGVWLKEPTAVKSRRTQNTLFYDM
jgi:hypothetical protein